MLTSARPLHDLRRRGRPRLCCSRATLLQRDLVAETRVVVRAVDLEHEANVPQFDRQPDLGSIQVEIARATHAPLAAYTAVAALRFRP